MDAVTEPELTEGEQAIIQRLVDLERHINVHQAEISLIRRALEATVDRLDNLQMPEYNEEFGLVYQSLDKLEKRINEFKKTEIIASPKSVLDRVSSASSRLLDDTARNLTDTARQTKNTSETLKGYIELAKTRFDQKLANTFYFLLGLVLCALLDGVIIPYLKNIF